MPESETLVNVSAVAILISMAPLLVVALISNKLNLGIETVSYTHLTLPTNDLV